MRRIAEYMTGYRDLTAGYLKKMQKFYSVGKGKMCVRIFYRWSEIRAVIFNAGPYRVITRLIVSCNIHHSLSCNAHTTIRYETYLLVVICTSACLFACRNYGATNRIFIEFLMASFYSHRLTYGTFRKSLTHLTEFLHNK
jgi:hypothetical protein